MFRPKNRLHKYIIKQLAALLLPPRRVPPAPVPAVPPPVVPPRRFHEILSPFMPAIFSAAAQLLVTGAANYEIKTTNWLVVIGLVSYMTAFGLYSFTVRNFPISIASPINTIAQ